MNTFKYVAILTLVVLVVGAVSYNLGNQKNQSKIDSLNSQLGNLQNQVSSLSKQLTSATTTDSCQSTNLSASLTDGSGTAGTYYYLINLKNTGSSGCSYSGKTTISLLDSNNNILGSYNLATSSGLNIPAGQVIYATVGFPDANNYVGMSACKVGVTTLGIYPPNQTTAVSVANINQLQTGFTDNYCTGFSVKAFSLTKPK